MARTYTHDTAFEIILPETSFDVDVELTYTYTPGSPAHYGSMSYAGHPAEPDDVEITGIKLTRTDSKTKVTTQLECPTWLFDMIVAGADRDLMEREAGDDLLDDDYSSRRFA